MSKAHLEAEKRAILRTALAHVPFDGWTARTLELAVSDAGFEPSLGLRAFPGGAVELLSFFIAEADRQMLEALEQRDLKRLKIRERIALAIRLRLEAEAPHKEAVRRALALLALPQNAPLALKSLYRTVDSIWYAVGDTATDFSFYSKRMLLAGVYSATVVYWLDDKSEAHARTWTFLDRRIEDVMRIQKLRGRLGEIAARLPDPMQIFRRRA